MDGQTDRQYNTIIVSEMTLPLRGHYTGVESVTKNSATPKEMSLEAAAEDR